MNVIRKTIRVDLMLESFIFVASVVVGAILNNSFIFGKNCANIDNIYNIYNIIKFYNYTK